MYLWNKTLFTAGCLSLFWSQMSAAITTPFSSYTEVVIFDCDGVLVDTEKLKFLAWQRALNEEGIPFTIEEYQPHVGHSSVNILKGIAQAKGVPIHERVIAAKNAIYAQLQKQGVAPIQATVNWARQLAHSKQQLGIRLALASSASRAEIHENLKQIGLAEVFELIISGSDDLTDYHDSSGKNKPKPYIYMEAAKRLGVDPRFCLVFEDTQAGIEAAKGAGMVAVAIPNSFTSNQDFSAATGCIQSIEELKIEKVAP